MALFVGLVQYLRHHPFLRPRKFRGQHDSFIHFIMSHHSIDISYLAYTYPDGTPGLRGLSLHVGHGESIAIVGGNGAGKSTLLHHLCGAILPESGEVSIGEIPLVKTTVKQIRQTVGMVFQNPEDQLFMSTVWDDVAFGPLNMQLPRKHVEERTRTALEKVNAWHLKDKHPHHLSGGEQKNVSIATILSMNPDILILDEPTANLDHEARRNVIRILRQFDHTKLIATHDLRLALELCERSVIMKDGYIIADGSTQKLFQNEELMNSARLEALPG